MPAKSSVGVIAGLDAPATALALLDAGLWPVPITEPDARVPAPGKQPIGKDWGATRHTPDSLRAIYRTHPRAGVGLKLGAEAGIVDVEVDERGVGDDSLARLLGGEEVATLGWDSSRGAHLAFRWDDRLARYGRTILKHPAFPGIEIRIGPADPGGKQLQSVVPPSPGTDGRPRAWNGVAAIAALPESFFVALDPVFLPNEPEAPGPAPRPIPPAGPASVEDRARAYLDRLPEAIEGQRGHDRLYRAACVLADGFALPYALALPILRDWNEAKAIPPESDRQVEHKLTDALKNTARSGYLLNAARAANGHTNGHANGHAPKSAAPTIAASPSADEEETAIVVREWPEPPGEAAYRGLAGAIVRALEPHTESDPVAILAQLLVGFGNLIGRTAYFAVEADRHHANLFASLVGPSSKARKGTSWGHVRRTLRAVEPGWAEQRVMGGLSSGEGLIWAVRDRIVRMEPVKERGRVVDHQEVEVDAGVADKRILAIEPELASVLKAMGRDSNTLSAIIRRAWDDGNLRTLTKNSPACATGAHASIVGHITRDELQRLMTDTEAANGFGNRFLWFCVRRSKLLPFGGDAHLVDFAPMVRALEFAAGLARGRGRLGRDAEADALWLATYEHLSRPQPGLLGSIVGRAEAQTMRLALIYALLDGAEAIGRAHLESALALWRYAEDSARYVFGDALGDETADAIMGALRGAPAGLTRSRLSGDVLGRNTPRAEVDRALNYLLEHGMAHRLRVPTGGRPAETWFAGAGAAQTGQGPDGRPPPY